MKTSWVTRPAHLKRKSLAQREDLREKGDNYLRVLVLSSDYFVQVLVQDGEDEFFYEVNWFYVYTFEQLRILLLALAEKEEDEK